MASVSEVTEIKRPYAPDTIDTDVANPAQTYFGQWTSRAPAASTIRWSRRDPRQPRLRQKGCVIMTAPNPKAKPVAMRTSLSTTCRIMTYEERGYCGVSLTEDEEIDGYVHVADLVPGDCRQHAEMDACRQLLDVDGNVARPAKPASMRRCRSAQARARPAREILLRAQCTLTVSSSCVIALAMAASRLSVTRIGVPSAACSANR